MHVGPGKGLSWKVNGCFNASKYPGLNAFEETNGVRVSTALLDVLFENLIRSSQNCSPHTTNHNLAFIIENKI